MDDIINKEYWVKKASKETVKMMENIFKSLREITNGYKLNYTQEYIGICRENSIEANNFIVFVPRRRFLVMECKIEKGTIDKLLIESGLEPLKYNERFKLYRFRVRETDMKSKLGFIKVFAKKAKANYYS